MNIKWRRLSFLRSVFFFLIILFFGTAFFVSATLQQIQFSPQVSAPATCDASTKGSVYFASSSPYFLVCNGVAWISENTNWIQTGTYIYPSSTTWSVGVGTTTPTYGLTIVGTGYFSQPVIVGTPTLSTHAATKAYVDSIVSPSATTTWILSGSFLYPSSTSWKIGIGTTTPSYELEVVGTFRTSATSTFSGNVILPSVSGTNGLGLLAGTQQNLLTSLQSWDASETNTLLFYNTNRYWTGSGWGYLTNSSRPGGTLQVFDDILRYYSFPASSLTPSLRFYIDTGGNVGIATSTPGYGLTVIGTSYFSQPVIVGTPTLSTHAATKAYVDSAGGGNWIQSGVSIYPSSTNWRVGIGTTTPRTSLEVKGAIVIEKTISSSTGVIYIASTTSLTPFLHNYSSSGHTGANTFLGENAGNFTLYARSTSSPWEGSYNVGFGTNALKSITYGYYNNTFGSYAGQSITTGAMNMGFGPWTLWTLTSGLANIAIGGEAMIMNQTGSYNTMIGRSSGYGVSGASNYHNNTAIGAYAGQGLKTGGDSNIFIGYMAATTTATGSNNIVIATSSPLPTTSTSNFLNIGHLIFGNLNTKRIGIGTSTLPVDFYVEATASTTIQVGKTSLSGCIALGDSDGSGITYITGNDGVLSAHSTKPSQCK